MNKFVKFSLLILVIAAVGFSAWYVLTGNGKDAISYQTVPVKIGDLKATISATGTVQPEELIDVGAQVAGKIVAFGTDASGKAIDYGSYVEKGTVLARIDESLYTADVAQARAQVEQARAGVERAEADLVQLQARLAQAERDWNRAKKLGPSEALSQSAYDAALSAYEVAKANVLVGNAAIVQAKNGVALAEAALHKAQQNLDYCTIKSPVSGVIVDRRVNIGQTVVASLNAPSLFLIAKDLRKLQIWVAVNEADIGSIQPGQSVTFTVDATPGRVYRGEVGKIRLNASMTQNVVTYTVEVITDNSDGSLLPYLTANVRFLVSERHDVLLVPNAALRWTPSNELSPGGREEQGQIIMAGANPGNEVDDRHSGKIWVFQDGSLREVAVRIGLTDGIHTEISSDELKEGMGVVIAEDSAEEARAQSTTNPFTPKFPRRGRR